MPPAGAGGPGDAGRCRDEHDRGHEPGHGRDFFLHENAQDHTREGAVEGGEDHEGAGRELFLELGVDDPTLTHRPEAGSPVVDTGDEASCPAVDQRGLLRPRDGDADGHARCDRGAVELAAALFVDGFESGGTGAWM